MAQERLEEMRKQRINKRAKIIAGGGVAYPSEVRRTHVISDVIQTFDDLVKSEETVMLLGRIMALRSHGAIAFIDIADESGKIQLQVLQEKLGDTFDPGDFVEVAGTATHSKRGGKTILVSWIFMASKTIRPIPNTWFGLKDVEMRSRQRELDLLVNPDAKETARARSKIVSAVRNYLLEKNFIEVETPILQQIPGGALAEPFTTHHNALNADLYLRIAPELYLKRLLIGGFEKVFEIGKNFRNEGIDKSHNPEFTMLEFYWAYADYEDLMDMTEALLSNVTTKVCGSLNIPWGDSRLSFQAPFARYSYIDLIKEHTGIDVMQEKNPMAYKAVLGKHGVMSPNVDSYGKLVDEVYKAIVRPKLQSPAIVYDYPLELVPLAKKKQSDPRIAEMFQLVIAGMEIVKAYTELNDPVEQRERFEEQQAQRDTGDREAHVIDEHYLRAMEYGMPPAAGFGLGIDRLVMLLTNTPHLRDIILFPLLKPEE